MTTLENSYCVPKTANEWKQLGVSPHSLGPEPECVVYENGHGRCVGRLVAKVKDYYSLVPVQHFIDLVDDRPSTWRIKEYQLSKGVRDGFWNVFYISQSHLISVEQDGSFNLNGRKVYIDTFTDLLTLIKFLTPP